ncbi:MAG TPA: hypothetical protein VH082_03965 [Rudaea sp.]|nr:hypothetical protein [Rudaea sp.]
MLSAFDKPARVAGELRFHGVVFLLCIVVKAALVALDDRVRLFMGDSATYLWSAATLHVPTDRSYSYPLFIRAITAPFGSIDALLWAQALCGAATATMTAWLLRDVFDVRRCVAICAALVVCLDPMQLFYERMVMTESLSTCALIASVCVAVAYIRNGRASLLAACIGLGLVSVSLRTGLAPLSLCLGAAIVLLRWDRLNRTQVLRHLAIAVSLTWSSHFAYQHLYGWATHAGPAYIRDGGLFRLGLVAPLVRAEDFEGTRVDAHVLDEVTIPLADERMREAQIWSSGGLIDVLKRNAGSRAYKSASKIATHAMRRDPLGVIKLGIATTADYFDDGLRHARLVSDLGAGQLPDERTLTLLRDSFAYDASGVARTPSPMYRYFEFTPWWPTACLFALAPLSLVAAFARARRNRAALLQLLVSCGLVVGQVLCAHIVSFRYLHPFTVLMTLNAAVVVDAAVAFVAKRRAHNEAPAVQPVEAMAT